jgi:hypothetical protein
MLTSISGSAISAEQALAYKYLNGFQLFIA